MFNASSLKCYKSPRKRDALRSGDAHEALRQLTWSALGAFWVCVCVFYLGLLGQIRPNKANLQFNSTPLTPPSPPLPPIPIFAQGGGLTFVAGFG